MAGCESSKVKPVCHVRQVKMGRMIYEYKRKTANNTQAEVPWLRLKGHWLQEAGFGINSVVTVRVMERCLVLTVESDDTSR